MPPNTQGSSRAAPNYGYGVVTLEPKAPSTDPQQIARRVVQVLDDPEWKPPLLPVVATQLLELTRNANVDYQKVAKLLQQDPALAAQLLRRANSAAYGAGVQILTIRDAVARLGLNGVSNLALEVAVSMRVFRVPGYQNVADVLRRHAVATGYLAGIVSRYTPFNGQQALLYGLLADVGLALGLLAVVECSQCTRGHQRPEISTIWPTLWTIHERVSARVSAMWKLDADITTVLGCHHSIRVGNVPHPMAAIVLVAADLASDLGASLSEPLAGYGVMVTPTPPDLMQSARDLLGLNGRQLDLARAEGQKLLKDIGGI